MNMVADLESAPSTARRRIVPSGLRDGFWRGVRVSALRHVRAARPFRPGEFGSSASRPQASHLAAANRLVAQLQVVLERETRQLDAGIRASRRSGAGAGGVLRAKRSAGRMAQSVEKIWDFYFEMFRQRMSHYGPLLLAADRIGADCYQAVYTRLGKARSVPSPAPFCYVENALSPATYRRGVSVPGLANLPNPFPLVRLPLHRLINPWSLGAVAHEVAHNLQADLGLWQEVPRRLGRKLLDGGVAQRGARVWTLWHKELWADLCGLLLGGPAIASSLRDLLAKPPREVARFNPRGVHPPPFLRVLVSYEALAQMGFTKQARAERAFWLRLYPEAPAALPSFLRVGFPEASRIAVRTMIRDRYAQLGGRSLLEVAGYTNLHHEMVQEAAGRVAQGEDPGILPARFLIGAARSALDSRSASPERIADNFYRALNER